MSEGRAGVGRRGSWSLVGAGAVDMRWNIIEGLTLAIQTQNNKLLHEQVPKVNMNANTEKQTKKINIKHKQRASTCYYNLRRKRETKVPILLLMR